MGLYSFLACNLTKAGYAYRGPFTAARIPLLSGFFRSIIGESSRNPNEYLMIIFLSWRDKKGICSGVIYAVG